MVAVWPRSALAIRSVASTARAVPARNLAPRAPTRLRRTALRAPLCSAGAAAMANIKGLSDIQDKDSDSDAGDFNDYYAGGEKRCV